MGHVRGMNLAPLGLSGIRGLFSRGLAMMLVLCVFTQEWAFAQAIITWKVDLEMENGQWAVVGGPDDLVSDPGDLKTYRALVKDRVESAAARREPLQGVSEGLRQEVEKRFPGVEAEVEPMFLLPDGRESRSTAMHLVFTFQNIQSVRLILSGGQRVSAEGSYAIKLGNEVALDPFFSGTLSQPVSLARALQADSPLIQEARFQDMPACKEDFSFQIAYANSEVSSVLKADGQDPSETQVRAQLRRQLRRLALRILQHFPEQKIIPGAVFDEHLARQRVARIIGREINHQYGSLVQVKLEPNQRLDVWIGLDPLPEKVGFALQGKDDQELRRRLRNRYLAESGDQRDRFLTSRFRYTHQAALDADLQYLMRDPDVSVLGYPHEETEGVILFDVARRPRVAKQVMLSASANVTPEKGSTGKLTLDASRLSKDIGQLSFSFEGGDNTLKGEGNIVLPVIKGLGGGLGRGMDAFARATVTDRDEALYGNLRRDPLDERCHLLEAGLIWSRDTLTHQDRFQAEDPFFGSYPGPRWLSKVECGFRYLDVVLRGNPRDRKGLDAGATAGPFVQGDAVLAMWPEDNNLSGHLRRVDFETRFDLWAGMPGLGGDEEGAHLRLDTGLKLSLQDVVSASAYLRHRFVFGLVSKGSSAATYLGTGDHTLVRGLERGEFIGRRFFGLQDEVGINLGDLWSLLSSKKSSENISRDRDEEPDPSPAFKDLYLSVFADSGWLKESIRDGREMDSARFLGGYGLLLSLSRWSMAGAPVDFSLGYGYSPQSHRNPAGIVFTWVNITF